MRSLRILVVEDEPINAEILGIMLSREGHAVFTAVDGPSGLALAREVRPDVVFMDVLMPGEFDGIEATRRLRAQEGFGGVIICQSARAGDTEQQQGYDAGADAYLTKPYKRRDVLSVLSTQVARKDLAPS